MANYVAVDAGGIVTDRVVFAGAMPAGWTDPFGRTLVASETALIGWSRQPDGSFAPPPDAAPPALTAGDIDAERDRRFALGAPIALTGKTFVADIDTVARINLTALAFVAAQGIAAGSTDTIAFRDHNNTTQTLTLPEIATMAQQAMARVTAVYAASWALKALSPIPADYAADTHWLSP